MCVPWGHILHWLSPGQTCSRNCAELPHENPGVHRAVRAPVGATGTRVLLGDRLMVVPCILVPKCIQQSSSSKAPKVISDFLKCCIESAESTGREISSLFAANFEFREASRNS